MKNRTVKEIQEGAEMTHMHHCDRCGTELPGFRDKDRCPDPPTRTCGKCLAVLFPEVRIYCNKCGASI